MPIEVWLEEFVSKINEHHTTTAGETELARVVDDGTGAAAAGSDSAPDEEEKSKIGLVIMTFLAGLGLGLVVGYILWGKQALVVERPGNESTTTTQAQNPVEVEPTQVPTPSVDRATVKVKVLNGSGVKGAAAAGRDLLNSLGYKNVDTGNADSQNNVTTLLHVKVGAEEKAALLREDLKAKYTVDTKTEVLEEKSEYDVIVTLGKSNN